MGPSLLCFVFTAGLNNNNKINNNNNPNIKRSVWRFSAEYMSRYIVLLCHDCGCHTASPKVTLKANLSENHPKLKVTNHWVNKILSLDTNKVITVPADVQAPNNARPPAGTRMTTKFDIPNQNFYRNQWFCINLFKQMMYFKMTDISQNLVVRWVFRGISNRFAILFHPLGLNMLKLFNREGINSWLDSIMMVVPMALIVSC